VCQIPRVESSVWFRGQRRTGFTSRIAKIPIAIDLRCEKRDCRLYFYNDVRYIDVALMTRAIKNSEARITCKITRYATRPSPSVTRLEFRCKFTGLCARKIARLPRSRSRRNTHTPTWHTIVDIIFPPAEVERILPWNCGTWAVQRSWTACIWLRATFTLLCSLSELMRRP